MLISSHSSGLFYLVNSLTLHNRKSHINHKGLIDLSQFHGLFSKLWKMDVFQKIHLRGIFHMDSILQTSTFLKIWKNVFFFQEKLDEESWFACCLLEIFFQFISHNVKETIFWQQWNIIINRLGRWI